MYAPTRIRSLLGRRRWFETRDRLSVVLPLEDHEREFLERLNGTGDIVPELLTADSVMLGLIRDHPGLTWKALNVKQHRQGGAAKERPSRKTR